MLISRSTCGWVREEGRGAAWDGGCALVHRHRECGCSSEQHLAMASVWCDYRRLRRLLAHRAVTGSAYWRGAANPARCSPCY